MLSSSERSSHFATSHTESEHAPLQPVATLVIAGLFVGVSAVAFRELADRPVDLVLFSGQNELPRVVAESSAGVLLLLVVAKCLAYALSLGAGFPGGARLPGARSRPSAVTAADILPGLETTPAVAAGIAAATYAVLRVPFMAVLLATLLVGSSAFDTAPISVLAAVVGWIVAIALPNPEDRREPQGGGHARQRVMISQRIVNPAAANLG